MWVSQKMVKEKDDNFAKENKGTTFVIQQKFSGLTKPNPRFFNGTGQQKHNWTEMAPFYYPSKIRKIFSSLQSPVHCPLCQPRKKFTFADLQFSCPLSEKMRKKRRVPEVLRRLFHNRPRTLADAITSLLPPHSSSSVPDHCRFCKGRRCLSCSGPNGMSFILRPNDPSDYRNLLNHCYVVWERAPTLAHFSPDSHWSQIEVLVVIHMNVYLVPCVVFV